MMQHKYQEALADADKCTQLDQNWCKGFYLKARVLAQTDKRKALKEIQHALKCDSTKHEGQFELVSSNFGNLLLIAQQETDKPIFLE